MGKNYETKIPPMREIEAKLSSPNFEAYNKPLTWHQKYAIYLQTNGWQSVRKYVFTRDGKSCSDCGKLGNIIHHNFYPKGDPTFYHEMPIELMALHCRVLCENCHKKYKGTKRIPESLPKSIPPVDIPLASWQIERYQGHQKRTVSAIGRACGEAAA